MDRNQQTARQAARASWQFPLVFAILGATVSRATGPFVYDLMMIFAILTGLGCGIFALWRVRELGSRGILGHAIAGVALGAFLSLVFVSNFLAALQRSRGL